LHGDQVVKLVAAVRGSGQPEPAPCRDLLDCVLERGGRDVMAFVGDDKAVPGGQLWHVVAAGQGLTVWLPTRFPTLLHGVHRRPPPSANCANTI